MRWIVALVAGPWLGGFAARAEPVRQDISGLAQAEIVALQRRLTDAGCYKGALDGAANAATKAAVLACPDQRPRLVIETGMHVAKIGRISVDRACTLAATASDDKTLRLWSLPDGRLLRTIRPPIGDGYNGKLYAAALTPDGRYVAAGGSDARDEVNGEMSASVFDALNGSLLARLGPFTSVINHLAFSPDGHWLVGHIADQGIVIFDTSATDPGAWTEAARDLSYKGDTYGSSWSRDGRLASVSDDGKLRLYGPAPGFRKIKEIVTLGGKQPYSVAFDPAQERLAVGYVDTTAVDIFDARDLRRIAAADTRHGFQVNGI